MSGRSFNRNTSYKEETDRDRPTQLHTGTPVSYRQEAHDRWSNNRPPDDQPDQVQTFAGWTIGISSGILAEHILAHPCIVLRRQCQVHHTATWYHLTPFTLLPVMYKLQQQQGMSALWKGISSAFVCQGVQMVSETVISEITPLPKEISRHHTVKKHMQHLLLKGLAFVVTTPFLVSSLVETVQSDVSSERPGVFNCVTEGVTRLMGMGSTQFTKLIPIWKLLLPTGLVGLSRYIIMQMARYTVITTIQQEEQEKRQAAISEEGYFQTKSMYDIHFPEMLANFTGGFLADMMFFPLETVLHRLYLQGTRTIIDNTDTGVSVIPINTSYQGIIDCFRDIILEEGLSGLYKGFGALLLQYAIHAAILRLAKFLFNKLSSEFAARNKNTGRL
ncbi:mitochondrial outer membrane protein SLC25A46-like [Mytilus californianus]|uniref:mitochondrial outer membrane protein SLC25A46-like n=1 Tax=Mytilus californianus TaxID=6549 RepID=UPI002245C8BC|nr:mitochondrial outer membrane protein SLC25A46-like [Mytilus californianus]